MKKIIILLTAVFMFAGLFGEGKIVIDEKAAQEIEKLKIALKSVGVEYELGAFIPESDENGVEDALTVDEFIESLESMSVRSTAYINLQRLLPVYEFVWTGSGWVLEWNGKVSSSPDIEGDDWDGVMHTRETSGGTVVETKITFNPTYAYLWDAVYESTPRLCAQLFDNVRVYVPGIGYMLVPQVFGSKHCANVNFNW
ncbi:MAG TPA: hypothetical protein PK560_12135 [bacterium]|jgi:hypothetical protein|nr:hypothetical protein [bacterium]MDX9805235.1 hypothetical protein [bacterium]HOG44816.1 hypothetical protein [bacterium]